MIQGAILYVRVSTQNQEEEGTSLHSQAEAGISYVKGLGLPVLNIYREVYTGAELYDRPKLSEAREDVKNGRCSHLIAYSIDRLSRDPIHLAILAMEAERHGVQLLFVTEPLDNSPEGALIRYVKGYAAQIEREKIRERCIRGKRAIALSGRLHNSGTELYGYTRQDGKRVIHTLESLIVADIFNRIVKEGDSVRAVARRLNRDGALPPSVGKRVYRDGRTPRWGKSTVTRILREPSYKGEAIAWRWQSKKIGGRQLIKLRPVGENIKLPAGTAPAIVDVATWEKAQPIQNGGVNKRNENREYLLRGHITCERCGCAMYSESSKGKRWYRCSSRDKRTGFCGALATPAKDTDLFVWESLKTAISDPSILAAGVKSATDESELTQLKAERRTVEKALEASLTGVQRIIRKLRNVDSPVLLSALDAEVKVAEVENQKLRGKLEDLDSRMKKAQGIRLDQKALKVYCKQIERKLGSADFGKKALALRAFAGCAVADGKRVTFYMNVSAFVAGVSATTSTGYSQNAILIPFPNKHARAA